MARRLTTSIPVLYNSSFAFAQMMREIRIDDKIKLNSQIEDLLANRTVKDILVKDVGIGKNLRISIGSRCDLELGTYYQT